ncbi:MAG: Crp/Fnr family transcriptional regulator [Bacteroidia bacterium]|nr:Crp/Fnr family transcriptional regulator [Bacteroidia bacterium]
MQDLLAKISSVVDVSLPLEERITSIATEIKFPKRSKVREESYVWKELYFIQKGCVRHYFVKPDGEELTCDFSMEGQFFTDFISLNQQTPSRYNYLCMEDCHCLSIPYGRLLAAYKDFPELETFGRLMAEQTANRISEMAHGLLTLKSEDRYRKLLEERPELLQRVPQKYIANFLGIKAESLSRIKRSIHQKLSD